MRSTYKKVSGMTAEIKIRRCYGCGSTLQSADRYEPGYVSSARQDNDEGLCDRCYRLRHPQADSSQTVNKVYTRLIEKAKNSGALLCYVVDSFSLDSSIVAMLSDLLKGCKVIAIVNKVDLLPEIISTAELLDGVKSRFAKQGIQPLDYLLTSVGDKNAIQNIRPEIDKYRQGKDVYFVGTLRVGKSSLINEFLKYYQNDTGRNITRETIGDEETLTLTAIPLDANSTLYDTPGLFEPHSLLNQIDRKTLKYVIPRTRIKVRNETVKEGETLIFGALSYMTFEDCERTELEIFFSSDVEITKVKDSRAESTFTELCQNGEGHPSSPSIRDASALEKVDIFVPAGVGDVLLSISGFGRVRFFGNNQKISVYVPKGVGVFFNSDK